MAYAPAAVSDNSGAEYGTAMAGRILFNCWYRDSAIQVAVCNKGSKLQKIRLGIGVLNGSAVVYASQSLSLEGKSLKQITFPLIEQRRTRGKAVPADHLFIYKESEPTKLVGSAPIQSMSPEPPQIVLSDYVVQNGKSILATVKEPVNDCVRLVFMARTLLAGESVAEGRPAEGSMVAATAADIRQLGMPQATTEKLVRQMGTHFTFIIPSGSSGWITMEYPTPSVRDCAGFAAPVKFYQLDEHLDADVSGSILHPWLLILNPGVIRIETVLPLEKVEIRTKKRSTEIKKKSSRPRPIQPAIEGNRPQG